jgi:multiple sugar transport system substrate-binding protein
MLRSSYQKGERKLQKSFIKKTGVRLWMALALLIAGLAWGTTYAAAPKVKIKVWTMNRHDAEYMTAMVNQFNKQNKDNIEIVYQIFTDNYQQTLDLAYATGEAPDVFMDATGVYEKRLPAGDLAALDSYLTPAFKKRFGNGAFLDGINMEKGSVYSLPAIGTTPRLIYNKSIFKRAGIKSPPRTVAEMARDAKLISTKLSKEGIFGYAQNFKNPTQALSRSVDYIMMRSGGVREGYDFKTGKFDFTGYKPILQAYKEIFSSNGAFPGCESLDIDPLRTQFAAGKIGMYISWTHSEPGVYQNQFPTKEAWDMAPLPTIRGVKGSNRINLAGRFWLMNSKTKSSKDAWKVMEFLYSDSLLGGYYERGLGLVMVPSAVKKAKKPETVQKWPAIQFDKHDKIWPNIPLNVRPEGKDMYQVFAEIIFGATDLDRGIADLNARYNQAFDKAVSEHKSTRVVYPNFNPAEPGKVFQK